MNLIMFNMRKNKICFLIPRNHEFLNNSLEEQKKILNELNNFPDAVLESNVTSNAKRYYRMARAVSREIHYHKMFTRLKIEGNSILSGIIQPEHAIEDIILKFFYHRFPKFIIILYSIRKKKTYFIAPIELKKLINNPQLIIKSEHNFFFAKSPLNLGTLLSILLPLVKENSHFKGILDSNLDINRLFKEFYNSQHIDSRENHRLFIQNMPLKYQKKKDLVVEKTFRTKTLDRFMDK